MGTPDPHMLRVQQLFVRHQGQLRAFVLAIWPDVGRADDVLREVFLTVTTKAADFQRKSNFLAWSREITQRKGPYRQGSRLVERTHPDDERFVAELAIVGGSVLDAITL